MSCEIRARLKVGLRDFFFANLKRTPVYMKKSSLCMLTYGRHFLEKAAGNVTIRVLYRREGNLLS